MDIDGLLRASTHIWEQLSIFADIRGHAQTSRDIDGLLETLRTIGNMGGHPWASGISMHIGDIEVLWRTLKDIRRHRRPSGNIKDHVRILLDIGGHVRAFGDMQRHWGASVDIGGYRKTSADLADIHGHKEASRGIGSHLRNLCGICEHQGTSRDIQGHLLTSAYICGHLAASADIGDFGDIEGHGGPSRDIQSPLEPLPPPQLVSAAVPVVPVAALAVVFLW
eukprot:gene14514-biopygen5354